MDKKMYPENPVLIIDDETQFLQSASFSLRSAGLNNIMKCQDSRDVLTLLKKEPASAIILDMLMPHITGKELLPKISSLYPDIPIIILTALNEVNIAVECMKNGAYDFLVKPVDKAHLISAIKRAIEYRAMRRENIGLNKSLAEAYDELEKKSKKQEELLEQVTRRQQQLTAILDASPNVLLLVDTNDVIREVNQITSSFFGLEPETIIGSTFEEFCRQLKNTFEEPEKFIDAIHRRAQTPAEEDMAEFHKNLDKDFRAKMKSPADRIITFFDISVGESQGTNAGTLWTFVDITELVKAGEMLHLIVDASPIPLIITKLDGSIVYCNEQLETLAGYSPSEMQSMEAPSFYKDPEIRTQIIKKLKQEGFVKNFEVELMHKKGHPVWALLSVVLTKYRNEPILLSGLYEISAQKQAVHDLEGANMNLRQAQSQLVQSEKMASLGMLVAGIAHEINSPVGAIASMHDTLVRAVRRLESKLTEKPDDLTALFSTISDANKVIASASSRVTEIVKRLRSFARLDEAELKSIDIHDSIEDTLVILRHELKHGITVEKNYGTIPNVSCYPGRINQVFLNILKNSSQAITPPGKISISTTADVESVTIVITDTGCGIPDEALKKIFDPGFTTKGVGVGTGLGLSITYQIIEDHSGTITADSQPGSGTTFRITLPLHLEERNVDRSDKNGYHG